MDKSFPVSSTGRADPECMLGHLLRILFKNDDFMNAVGLLQGLCLSGLLGILIFLFTVLLTSILVLV